MSYYFTTNYEQLDNFNEDVTESNILYDIEPQTIYINGSSQFIEKKSSVNKLVKIKSNLLSEINKLIIS